MSLGQRFSSPGALASHRFRSMLLHAAKQKLPHRIFFFYSNQRPEDAPLLEELQAFQQQGTT